MYKNEIDTGMIKFNFEKCSKFQLKLNLKDALKSTRISDLNIPYLTKPNINKAQKTER